MISFRKVAGYAAVFAIASSSASSVHARPGQIPGLAFVLPFAEVPLSTQQKLRHLEDKIYALAEGRLKLSLKEGILIPDVSLLRNAVMESMPSGTLKTNMLVALNTPAGIALVSAYLFYANGLNESLADGWADPKNFRDETPKPQSSVQAQSEVSSKSSQEPQKLTDSGRLSDPQPTSPQGDSVSDQRLQRYLSEGAAAGKQSQPAKSREFIVTFRGVKLKVDETFSPKDKSGMEFIEKKILWLIDFKPEDLQDFIRVLSPEELRVFDSVLRAMANKREYSAFARSDVFGQIRGAISGALGADTPSQ